MNNTDTRYWKKTLLKQFVLEDNGDISLYALFMLGIMAAVMQVHVRWSLNIPGHHGVEWMAIFLFGRMLSRHHWAGMIIAAGAATTYMMQVPFLPLAHTFKPALIFLLNGMFLDVLFRYTPKSLPLFLKGMVLGGICYMIKPVVMLLLVISFGITVGTFSKYGYYYPMLTHFLFGSVGGICGISLARLITVQGKKK